MLQYTVDVRAVENKTQSQTTEVISLFLKRHKLVAEAGPTRKIDSAPLALDQSEGVVRVESLSEYQGAADGYHGH
jgi:hypothetical protein